MGGVMTTATATTSTTEGEELQLFLPTLPLVFFIQCERGSKLSSLFLPLSLSLLLLRSMTAELVGEGEAVY